MQWTTSDSAFGDDGLAGIEALAGFNIGDGENYITIPGSRTSSIIDIDKTSNIGTPGVWMFQVDLGINVVCMYFPNSIAVKFV